MVWCVEIYDDMDGYYSCWYLEKLFLDYNEALSFIQSWAEDKACAYEDNEFIDGGSTEMATPDYWLTQIRIIEKDIE